jgi:Cu(I)/Ag(I) efflux system membrane fusion protein
MSSSKTLIAVAVAAATLGAALGLLGQQILTAGQGVSAHASVPPAPTAPATTTQLGQSLIQLIKVQEDRVRDVVTLNGKLALDGTRIHQISSRLAGRVDRMESVEGASVQTGQAVAWLYSPEFISAQNEFLLARGAVRTLSAGGSVDLQADARATMEGARHKLRVLGSNESDIAELERSGLPQPHLVIRAAMGGRLIKRNVDPGGYLDVGGSLGTVADLSSLWFLGNVFDADLPRVREGQTVDIRVNGVALNEPLKGRVSFVSPSVDPLTHSVAVRVQLQNPRGLLKPEMFARAELLLGERRLPVVPRAAVVQDGAESFVVVQRGGTTEKPAYVRVAVETLPANDPGHLAILHGVAAGESVVVDGSVLIERELHSSQTAHAVTHTVAQARGTDSK